MREFGKPNAVLGYILCEEKSCKNNKEQTSYGSSVCKTMGTGHELVKGGSHQAVVVYFDNTHKVLGFDALEILRLTGVRIPEKIIE